MADGFAQLDAMIATVQALPELARTAAPDVAREVQAELERTIAAGTTPDGEPWAPKKDGGKPLVGAAGALAVAAVGTTVVIRLTGPEARHHRGWAKGGTTRQVIPIDKIPAAVARRIKSVMTSKFREAVAAVPNG